MKRVAVITSSDKGYKGEREDLSGPAVKEIVEAAGYVVVSMDVLPDDRGMLGARMAEIADQGLAELILTTGGTGFSKRDVTPEATRAVVDREIPAIPQAMLFASLQITPRAMLSRAAAGTRGQSLIVNLPGSEKAAKENLEAVLHTLGHALEMLRGGGHDRT